MADFQSLLKEFESEEVTVLAGSVDPMEKAKKIAFEEFEAKKLAVISGIGARDWFYDLGYKIDGVYVSKPLI